MTFRPSLQHCARILQHFTMTRGVEVLALQAPPFFGCLLGHSGIAQWDLLGPGFLGLGSLALTAHVFVFNDWAGRDCDVHDPQRSAHVFSRQGITGAEVAWAALALLIVSIIAFAVVGGPAMLLGAAIAMLSLFYSCSPGLGKRTPIAASVNHLVGGSLHFLLGYTLYHPLDISGLLISVFFGLVFAGGHLNQEVRDYDGDKLNGIRTSAVVFGRKTAFLASLSIFSAAYALAALLAARGVLPKLVLLSLAEWLLHILWSRQALRRGLGFDTALWMQKRYRVLFGIIGLAMLTRW